MKDQNKPLSATYKSAAVDYEALNRDRVERYVAMEKAKIASRGKKTSAKPDDYPSEREREIPRTLKKTRGFEREI